MQAPPNLTERLRAAARRRASTTGAASRRSRSTTSTPRRRGPSSSCCARRARAAGSSSRRGSRSTRASSTGDWLDPARAAAGAARVGLARARARGRVVAGRDRRPMPVRRPPRRAAASTPADELGEDEIVRLFRARGEERQRVFAAADALRREVNGDDGHLRRDAERPVHERLLLPLRLLRVLEGQARGEPARRAVPRPARGDRAPRRSRRGSAARRRSACRAASTRRSTATTTPRSCARSRTRCPSCTCTRSARSRSGRARRRSASPLRDVPRAAARRGARVAAGHGGRGARRRGARGHLPGQDHDRAVARGARDGARGRACARTTRSCSATSTARRAGRGTCVAVRELAAADGRLHRVRAAAVRAHGGADLPAGAARGPGRRSGETLLMHAVGRLALHPWIENVQVSWVKAGPAGRGRGAARRRQRPRRHADERVDLARGRLGVGAGAARPSGWRR